MTLLDEALDLARSAALEAGELLLSQLGRLVVEEIGSKSAARDLVTAADLASERLIVRRIRERFGDHAIEAEEEVHEQRRDGLRWLVDPLDGTVNFVHGIPCFCVSIAMYDGDVPQVAVVHAPRLGETFCATRGGGATLNGKPIRVSSATGALGLCARDRLSLPSGRAGERQPRELHGGLPRGARPAAVGLGRAGSGLHGRWPLRRILGTALGRP